jgi:hypothetical protein
METMFVKNWLERSVEAFTRKPDIYILGRENNLLPGKAEHRDSAILGFWLRQLTRQN